MYDVGIVNLVIGHMNELAVQDDQLSLSHLSATICAELAAGLADVEGIKEKHELSDAQWDRLKVTPAFRNMLKDALQKLSGDMNAGKRIMMKAEILLEDSLPVLDRVIHNSDGSTQSKIDSIKQLTILAGKTGKIDAEGHNIGQGFNVSIHINTGEGRETQPITIVNAEPED